MTPFTNIIHLRFIVICALAFACLQDGDAQGLKGLLNKITGKSATALTNEDVIAGLKEALTIGAKTSSESASAVDGFFKNPNIFIPWPTEAQSMKNSLVKIGLEKQVSAFEESMNRAAEEAAKGAFDVFAGAVKGMTISDGFAILSGNDTAATHYLREKSFVPLKEKFTPIVKNAIEKVQVTSYWNPLVSSYNKIPGVKKQNPNLEDYITTRAIDGLMVLIGEQEAKIRKDPVAQTTDLLKKVFGQQK